jgi:hypothetical protein
MVLWEFNEGKFNTGKAFLERYGLRLDHSNLLTAVQYGRIGILQKCLAEFDLTYLYNTDRIAIEAVLLSYTQMVVNNQIPFADKTLTSEFIFTELNVKVDSISLQFFFAAINGLERDPSVQLATRYILKNGVMPGNCTGPRPDSDPKAIVKPITEDP